ncbi:hypothetical protein [Amycolatopsis albispora]|uniref:hypothetical protein n=1 Tax=Amycolatopsis albispora TaxID=1804986 RepID=UPI0013B3EA44|nr:hypothetical protein [Amycolatopsis albispora]
MRTAPPVPAGFGFPLGVVLGAAGTALAVAVGAKEAPVVSLVAMVVVVDATAMVTAARAAVATAAVCWALHSGFVLGEHAELTFTAESGRAAAVLALCVLTASGFASLLRSVRAPRREAR